MSGVIPRIINGRCALRIVFGAILGLSIVASMTLYDHFFQNNFADTRYWIPRSMSKLRTHLQWKSDGESNPVVRTKGCDVDMAADDGVFRPSINIQLPDLSSQLTVVTAYFYIAGYRKSGSSDKLSTHDLYRQWMTSFALVHNPLVVYVDNDEDFEHFLSIRRHHNQTCLVQLERSRMWAFSSFNRRRVKNITSRVGYPQLYPNTIIEDYSLTQNAKYEVMQMTIRRNPYRTRYIAWIDIGLFRDITSPQPQRTSAAGFVHAEVPHGQPHFRLDLPPLFDASHSIAFSEVYERDLTMKPKAIVYKTKVWISGAYFVGRVDLMYRWTQDYLAAYEWLIRNNLTNTDEQVVYCLYNAAAQRLLPAPQTVLQAYKRDRRYSKYFNVGYQSRVMLSTAVSRLRSLPSTTAWGTVLLIACWLTPHHSVFHCSRLFDW